MSKPDRLWDWLAGWYDRMAAGDSQLAWAHEKMLPRLNREDRVLDFACASGRVALSIAEHVGEVHGVDTSSRMIELAQQAAAECGAENTHFSQIADSGPFPCEGPFDRILALNILHLLPEPAREIARFHSLLKPDGLLISLTPCVAEAGVMVKTVLPGLVRSLRLLSCLRKFTESDVSRLLTDGGFRMVEQEKLADRIPVVYCVGCREEGG